MAQFATRNGRGPYSIWPEAAGAVRAARSRCLGGVWNAVEKRAVSRAPKWSRSGSEWPCPLERPPLSEPQGEVAIGESAPRDEVRIW